MSLSGGQVEALSRALRSAFPTFVKLAMLLDRLDRNLADITAPTGMKEVVFLVLKEAESEGWIEELVTGALLANPRNPDLLSLHAQGIGSAIPVARRLLEDRSDSAAADLLPQAGALAALPGRQELESILNTSVGFLDVVPFVVCLLEKAGQVCRIEVNIPNGTSFGSGLLVGPDLVLTNHHVLAPVIEGGSPSGVRCRFDYRLTRTGTEKWAEHGLSESWLAAADSALDFALVRLDAAPGEDRVPGGKRGWSDLSSEPPVLVPGMPLLIVQHPNQLPVKVVLDTEGVLAVSADGSRVTYRTNTFKGSSGSPCFTLGLELVALHHSGEPTSDAGHNQGIPTGAIRSWLRAHGPAGLLGH